MGADIMAQPRCRNCGTVLDCKALGFARLCECAAQKPGSACLVDRCVRAQNRISNQAGERSSMPVENDHVTSMDEAILQRAESVVEAATRAKAAIGKVVFGQEDVVEF